MLCYVMSCHHHVFLTVTEAGLRHSTKTRILPLRVVPIVLRLVAGFGATNTLATELWLLPNCQGVLSGL